jgi:hypothetical protein
MTASTFAGDASLRDRFALALDAGASDAEIAFLRAHAAADGPTLVAPCGIGSLLVPLAAAGVAVHGVDPSTSALALAEARLRAAGREALLVRQPLDELNLAFRYRAAIVPEGTVDGFADPARLREGLRRIAAHLVAPATLSLAFGVPPEARHAPAAPLVEVRSADFGGGARIVRRSETTVDVETRRIDRVVRYEKREGRVIVARQDERVAETWYERDEIAPLLRDAGFTDVVVADAPWADDGDGERWIATAALA